MTPSDHAHNGTSSVVADADNSPYEWDTADDNGVYVSFIDNAIKRYHDTQSSRVLPQVASVTAVAKPAAQTDIVGTNLDVEADTGVLSPGEAYRLRQRLQLAHRRLRELEQQCREVTKSSEEAVLASDVARQRSYVDRNAIEEHAHELHEEVLRLQPIVVDQEQHIAQLDAEIQVLTQRVEVLEVALGPHDTAAVYASLEAHLARQAHPLAEASGPTHAQAQAIEQHHRIQKVVAQLAQPPSPQLLLLQERIRKYTEQARKFKNRIESLQQKLFEERRLSDEVKDYLVYLVNDIRLRGYRHPLPRPFSNWVEALGRADQQATDSASVDAESGHGGGDGTVGGPLAFLFRMEGEFGRVSGIHGEPGGSLEANSQITHSTVAGAGINKHKNQTSAQYSLRSEVGLRRAVDQLTRSLATQRAAHSREEAALRTEILRLRELLEQNETDLEAKSRHAKAQVVIIKQLRRQCEELELGNQRLAIASDMYSAQVLGDVRAPKSHHTQQSESSIRSAIPNSDGGGYEDVERRAEAVATHGQHQPATVYPQIHSQQQQVQNGLSQAHAQHAQYRQIAFKIKGPKRPVQDPGHRRNGRWGKSSVVPPSLHKGREVSGIAFLTTDR